MKDDERTFSIDELAELTGASRRTIRFYIQSGLLDRPEGTARGAHYARRHLQRLLDIAAWQAGGLTLEGIRQRLEAPPEAPPARPKSAVELWTRVTLAEGVELHLNAEAAGLLPNDMRRLAAAIKEMLTALKEGEKTND